MALDHIGSFFLSPLIQPMEPSPTNKAFLNFLPSDPSTLQAKPDNSLEADLHGHNLFFFKVFLYLGGEGQDLGVEGGAAEEVLGLGGRD
jgi:hypothetical protein